MGFELHERLAADTLLVKDLPLSRVLLMNDARYPWLILVPRVEDIREIHHLSRDDQLRLLDESCLVSGVLERLFAPNKLNVAALGNVVPQLHLHHVARYQTDPAWPGPVWGHSAAEAYAENEAEERIRLILERL